MSEQKICLDLFAGLGGFSAAFEDDDDWRVITVDIDSEFDTTHTADVLDLRPSDVLEWLPSDYDTLVVLASPPCTAFSMAAHGTHLDSDGNPVSKWGRESLTLTHHTIGLIKGVNPDWWIVENPMGGMRQQLGKPDAHVWWCQYGSDRAKPTDFWGDIPPSFDARRCWNGNSNCHHESAPAGSKKGTQADGMSRSERAKIPRGLSGAVFAAVESPKPEQTTLDMA